MPCVHIISPAFFSLLFFVACIFHDSLLLLLLLLHFVYFEKLTLSCSFNKYFKCQSQWNRFAFHIILYFIMIRMHDNESNRIELANSIEFNSIWNWFWKMNTFPLYFVGSLSETSNRNGNSYLEIIYSFWNYVNIDFWKSSHSLSICIWFSLSLSHTHTLTLSLCLSLSFAPSCSS